MKKNIRKTISLILVFALALCYAPAALAAGTESEIMTSGDFEYKIITPDEGEKYSELVKYKGELKDVTVPDTFGKAPLKVIGFEAFFGLNELTGVTLPDGVEMIDDRAFCGCSKLSRISMPDTVKVIGDYAFSNCYYSETQKDSQTGITTITYETGISYFHMPLKLEKIGDSAFAGCELLVGNTDIPSNITGSPDAPALIIPTSLTYLGAEAFSLCRSLVNVIIPEGIDEIKAGTFTNCASLEYVEIPSTVLHIAPAFNGAFSAHTRFSEYYPILYIKAPHCEIERSTQISDSVVICGAAHSSVQAFVDEINKERDDEYFYKDWEELVGTTPDIKHLNFFAIEVPGHTFVGTVTVPTCTEWGYTTYVCKECKEIGYYEEIDLAPLFIPHVCEYTAPLGHDYDEWITYPNGEATCTSDGSKYRICKRPLTDEAGNPLYNEDTTPMLCGHKNEGKIPALKHKFNPVITATCTTSGRSWNECEYCGVKQDFKTLPALGHMFDYENPDEVIVETVPCVAKDAEDFEEVVPVDGKYVYVCPLCGLVQVAVQSAHIDENHDGLCDRCEAEIGVTDLSPEKDCKCSCHSEQFIIKWFFKIKLFFWKLFGVNKVCDCGIMHY